MIITNHLKDYKLEIIYVMKVTLDHYVNHVMNIHNFGINNGILLFRNRSLL
jgi:hypothetical protein